MCVVGRGWLGSRVVINEGDVPRELTGLVVPLAGSLEVTGDLFLPYRLVGGDGVAVGPVTVFFVLRRVDGFWSTSHDSAFVWHGFAALVPTR
jgi:hypothetical protein